MKLKRPAWHVVVAYLVFAVLVVAACMAAPPVRGSRCGLLPSIALLLLSPGVIGMFAGPVLGVALGVIALLVFWGSTLWFVLLSRRRVFMVCAYIMLAAWAASLCLAVWLSYAFCKAL